MGDPLTGLVRRRRRRRTPVAGMLAVAVAILVVVGTGLALTGPFGPSPPQSQLTSLPAPSGQPLSPTPRPSPSWSLSGPPPPCTADAAAPSPSPSPSPAAPDSRAAQLVREVSTQGSRVGRPAGLSYSPEARLLMVFPEALAGSAAATTTVGMMTLLGDPGGATELLTSMPVPTSAAFDAIGQRLVSFDPGTRELVSVRGNASGTIDSGSAASRFDLRPLGLAVVAASAADPVDGSVYLLEPGRKRVVRLGVDSDPAGEAIPALRDGGVCVIDVSAVGAAELTGLAVDPASGHLLVLVSQIRRLFEFDRAGNLLVIHDLSPLGIDAPLAIAFAPSGDPTETESISHLYLLDHVERAGGGAARDRVVELDLRAQAVVPGPPPASDVHAVLVQTILTSRWTPVSSDPSGLAYIPGQGILVSDAEVDETASFRRANLFQAALSGTLTVASLTSFSAEPSGLAIDPQTGLRFVSDDIARRIYVVDPGPDGAGGTADDHVSSFDSSAFGSFDPEGLAYGQGSLFIADGLGAEVFRLSPGPNGVLDGVAPDGDDKVTRFDTRSLGQPTPEGIEFAPDRNSLFIASNDRRSNLLEVTTAGAPIRAIDLSFLNALAPAGLAYGPGSAPGGAPSIFIADRGIDNSRDPAENDGRVYEIRIVRGAPPNLIANPGMELDADRDGAIDGWDEPSGVSPTRQTARSGDTSMRLEAPAAGLIIDQRIPSIAANRSFTFALWLNVPPTDAPIHLRLRLRWRNEARATIATQRIAAVERSTAGWDRIVATFRSPPGAAGAVITIALDGAGSVVFVDDVLLIPVG